MTETHTTRPPVPWLALAGLVGFWFAVSRILSPQWSVYVQYNYGWAVPFLCIYLLVLRWPDRPELGPPAKRATLALLAISALLILPARITAEANLIWRVGSWAMAILLVAMTLCIIDLAGGRSWLRHFGFAVAFFLVAIPWPSALEGATVQSLMQLNITIVVEVLTLFGIPALPRGNVIEISTGLVGIDEACSGIRSLQATLMMALFFGEYYRLRVARRGWLILAGGGLALICNAIRTMILVLVCHWSGLDALDKWHDPTGLGILLACFGGLWLVARKFRMPGRAEKAEAAPPRREWPQVPGPVATALVAWLLVVEGGTLAWFELRERTDAQLSNWQVRWPTGKPNLREVELSPRVRAEMRFNEGRAMSWEESDGRTWQVFYFRWGPAKSLRERVHVQFAKTHRPEICLPASGLKLRSDRGVKDFSIGNLTLPFRAFEFEDRGLTVHVYFCAWEDGTRGIASNMRQNTASRFGAALAGSRSVSQRVLEIAVWGNQTAPAADESLRRRLAELIEN